MSFSKHSVSDSITRFLFSLWERRTGGLNFFFASLADFEEEDLAGLAGAGGGLQTREKRLENIRLDLVRLVDTCSGAAKGALVG